jgi:RimJ/RimL family protein N-acetyltransferase
MNHHVPFDIRRAAAPDAEAIAAAHLDSIRTLGPGYYGENIVRDWGARVQAGLYLRAMRQGEVFFVAIDARDSARTVLGFSSHRVDGIQHGVAVYVRGSVARRGIGSALLRAAEHHAIASGATSVQIDASLAAVDFYKHHGFDDIGRGAHRLWSGRSMPCVFMTKSLSGRVRRGTLTLPRRTSRLTLRDIGAADFEAIHAYASDPDVTRYMFYGPRSEEDTRAYLERVLATQISEPRRVWEVAIVETAGERLVGACDLTLDQPDEADLGFVLSREVWGRGYATEAARALVRAGFDELGVKRIFATCDVSNHASARVLEKAGLRREATLNRHKFAKDMWWTSFLYAITFEQWARDPV